MLICFLLVRFTTVVKTAITAFAQFGLTSRIRLQHVCFAAALVPVEDVDSAARGHVVGRGEREGFRALTLVVVDGPLPVAVHHTLDFEEPLLRLGTIHVHVQQPVVRAVAERG